METALKIFTDGGCSGNPGPGGWAYLVVLETLPSPEGAPSLEDVPLGEGAQGGKILAEQWGAEKNTTNNRMELTAVIESLRGIKTMNAVLQNDIPREAAIYTDSQYVQKGITGWIRNWKRNAWRTSDKKPVKNQDLWIALDALAGEFSLKWEWVPGHAGVEYNERCDKMTQEAIRSIIGN